MLSDINWWRHKLRRPLLPPSTPIKATTEFILGTVILRKERIPMRDVSFAGTTETITWAQLPDNTLDDIHSVDLLNALPYSCLGHAIVDGLKGVLALRDIENWHSNYTELEKK